MEIVLFAMILFEPPRTPITSPEANVVRLLFSIRLPSELSLSSIASSVEVLTNVLFLNMLLSDKRVPSGPVFCEKPKFLKNTLLDPLKEKADPFAVALLLINVLLSAFCSEKPKSESKTTLSLSMLLSDVDSSTIANLPLLAPEDEFAVLLIKTLSLDPVSVNGAESWLFWRLRLL